MAQPLLKRRLNPFLLISTVAALSLLAGVSVLYQDQISQKTNQVENINQTKAELQTEINEMEAQLQNRSIRMTELEKQINSLEAEKNSLNNTIGEKDQKIQELESQVQEAQDNSELEDTIDDINSSLSFVCAVYSGGDPSVEGECQDHNHEVGTSEG